MQTNKTEVSLTAQMLSLVNSVPWLVNEHIYNIICQ